MEITIKRGEERFGPYGLEDVRAYRAEGRLAPDDLASTDGENWRPVGELLGEPAPALPYPPAGLGMRFVAGVIDLCVVGLCVLAVLWAIGAGFQRPTGDREGLVMIAGLVIGVFYPFVKDGLPGGRSLGKRLTGLMVVHLASNRPCSVLHSALRTLLLVLTNMLPGLGGLVEPVVAILTRDHRRLGDRAAGTMVIRAADHRP